MLDDFKVVRIVPVYNGRRDSSECSNYRKINILSVVGKLYGRISVRFA